MARGRNHWGEKKQMKESHESYAARLERRRYLTELRGTATEVERDGKTYSIVIVPSEYRAAVFPPEAL